MNKKKQIEELQKMCQDYSDLVDMSHNTIDRLLSMITNLEQRLSKSVIDFEKDEDPSQQLAKILVSLSDADWGTLGSEMRVHLLNDHSKEWVKHPRIAGKFSTIESIVMNTYEVERRRRLDGSL